MSAAGRYFLFIPRLKCVRHSILYMPYAIYALRGASDRKERQQIYSHSNRKPTFAIVFMLLLSLVLWKMPRIRLIEHSQRTAFMNG